MKTIQCFISFLQTGILSELSQFGLNFLNYNERFRIQYFENIINMENKLSLTFKNMQVLIKVI